MAVATDFALAVAPRGLERVLVLLAVLAVTRFTMTMVSLRGSLPPSFGLVERGYYVAISARPL